MLRPTGVAVGPVFGKSRMFVDMNQRVLEAFQQNNTSNQGLQYKAGMKDYSDESSGTFDIPDR